MPLALRSWTPSIKRDQRVFFSTIILITFLLFSYFWFVPGLSTTTIPIAINNWFRTVKYFFSMFLIVFFTFLILVLTLFHSIFLMLGCCCSHPCILQPLFWPPPWLDGFLDHHMFLLRILQIHMIYQSLSK